MTVAAPQVFGREQELARIDALLATALGAESGALVVRGAAGIGKTALLEAAIRSAGALRVLRARGIESEAGLPGGALVELLRPITPSIDGIPPHLAQALRGALALGPPMPVAPLQLGVAVLAVLAVAAEEQPVLVVVDDLHWIDEASAGALLFTARRLGSEGVAIVFAMRDGEARVYDTSGIEELALNGLDRPSARGLVELVDPAVTEDVFARLYAGGGGNPLALIESVRLLGPEERTGRAPLPAILRSGQRIERAFSRRISELSADARRALLVAAAADSSDSGELAAALRCLGLSLEALAEAEATGLVAVGEGSFQFLHPLLRSVTYHAATAGERRAARGALAHALADTSSARSVLHQAAAALAPDEAIADALERVANEAAAKGGPIDAARVLERAAALTPDRAIRARRLLRASQLAALGASFAYADALADRGRADADDAALRAEFELHRGLVRMSVGSPGTASDELAAGAERIERSDPDMAALMLATASFVCLMQGDCHRPLELAERSVALARTDDGLIHRTALANRAMARTCAGRGREEAATLLRLASSLERSPVAPHPAFLVIGQQLVWVERFADAARILRKRAAVAREQASPMFLIYDLASLAETELWLGDLAAAYADAAEAARLARDTHAHNYLSFCVAILARVEAGLGRTEACRQHSSEARRLADSLGTGSIFTYTGAAIGLLELGLANPEATVRALEPVAERAMRDGVENPNVVPWQPDLIEAYARCDRPVEAERELEVLERRARTTGSTWAAAAALRCRGLLGGRDRFEERFERALELHATQPLPLERARTELCLGERLRRIGRRAEAREPLRRAFDTFERAGARPWLELARAELAASGERGALRTRPAELELTAQELQVARVVAAGASNAEAASQLFLSPKTVEKHLTSAYRKLGLRSRAQLAAMFAANAPAGIAP